MEAYQHSFKNFGYGSERRTPQQTDSGYCCFPSAEHIIPDNLLEMKGPNSISEVLVASPEQCRILLSPEYRSLVKKLIATPLTLSQLSKETGQRLDSIYYKVKKLEKMGLSFVEREERRRGKPLKFYSMTARKYDLPFKNTTSATLEELLVWQMAEHQELFSRHLVEYLMSVSTLAGEEGASFRIELHDEVLVMNLRGTPVLDEDSTIIHWRPIHLRPKDAVEFYREMIELTERFSMRGENRERREHLLSIQLVRKT